MKKIIILLFIAGVAKFSFSQWYSNGATWYYNLESWGYDENSQSYYTGEGYVKYEVVGDTLIDTITAKIIIKSGKYFSGNPLSQDTIIVYADSNRAYFWTGYDFRLMYDFNLEVGDTLDVDVYNTSICDSISPLVVDSIDTITADGISLRVQYITLSGNTTSTSKEYANYTYRIIEYIEDVTKTGYDFLFVPTCEDLYPSAENNSLRCFHNENFTYYNDWWQSDQPCDTIINPLGVELLTKEHSNILLYPNPAMNNINIESNSELIKQVKIINSLGQILIDKKVKEKEVSIDINSFTSGIYNAIIILNNGQQVNKKFVKK
jgi:hypothetical protein